MRRTEHTILAGPGRRIAASEYVPDDGPDPALPTLVLAHGWTLSRTSWVPVIEALLRHVPVRVLAYDQPGHGGSSPWSRTPTVRELGDVLAAVLHAAVPAGPVVLGGHSMGGMTVMAYAAREPEAFGPRIRGVALVSTAAALEGRRAFPGERVAMRVLARLPARSPSVPLPTRAYRPLFGAGVRRADLREAARIMNSCRAATIGGYFGALLGHDERAALPALGQVPTQILAGSTDPLTPVRWARDLHAEIPGSELTVLPGLGHMLTWEAPDEVAGALAALLTGGSGPGVS